MIHEILCVVSEAGDAEELWRQAVAFGAPLISPVDEDGMVEVTFLWRGEATTTMVARGLQLPLRRVPGTDLWRGSMRLPADERTLYTLAHDGADHSPRDASGTGAAHVDPLNRHPFHFPADPADPTDYDSWASLLELPRARKETWGAPPAVVEATLPGGRRVAVYRPPGERPAGGFATLVVFDGWLARQVLRIPQTLDGLIAAGRIPPLLALFVPGRDADRDADLAPSSTATTDFVARELVPWARREWGAGTDPRRTVVAGVSLGGLAAANIALQAPDVFGGVIAQSGSFWWPRPEEGEPGWLIREYAARPRADLRFYLDVGDQEMIRVFDVGPTQLEVNRRMRDVLQAKGYPVTYAEYRGGHDYVNWRSTFADGLLAVLGS